MVKVVKVKLVKLDYQHDDLTTTNSLVFFVWLRPELEPHVFFSPQIGQHGFLPYRSITNLNIHISI